MPRPSLRELNDPLHFQPLAWLKHYEGPTFVADYYLTRRSWLTWLHYVLIVLCIGGWIQAMRVADLPLRTWIVYHGLAIVLLVLVLPLHELLHGLAYWVVGARDIRFAVSWRQGYAFATAHHFVTTKREFFGVALTPFVVISVALVALLVAVPTLQVVFWAVLLIHTSGTCGDLALLNFYWLHRHHTIYTYDDAELQTSYFFTRR